MKPFLTFLAGAFSEDNHPSSSRLMCAATVTTACVGLLHVVWHAGSIPDALTLGGLAAFAVCPYAVNQTKNAVTSFSKPNVGPQA